MGGRGGTRPVCPLRWGGPLGTGTRWWFREKWGWEAAKGAPRGRGRVSMGPPCLPNHQAAALHSKLHSHQPVHVLHAPGGSHPHPRPAAASSGPRARGPGPHPLEPGECSPCSSRLGIQPPLVGRRFPRYPLLRALATVSSLWTTPERDSHRPLRHLLCWHFPILFLLFPTTGLSHP